MKAWKMFRALLENKNQVQVSLDQIKELIMGLNEDFTAFVVSVNARTNEISAALDEIKLDIAALKNQSTTPEMATAMAEIQTKLAALSTTAAAIAADDTPVVPPVEEPPL